MDSNLVGRYKLLRRLAAGGMGEVFLAAQAGPAGFEKVVALKRLLPSMGAEREVVRLFLDEARLVARLSHRNICQIYDLGEDGEGYFVAMEYIQGASVRTLLDRLSSRTLASIIGSRIVLRARWSVMKARWETFSATDLTGSPQKICSAR